MKRQTKSAETIEGGNAAAVEGMALDADSYQALYDLLMLLGEVADAIAAGEDIYLTFGANRAKTALVFTLSDGGEKTYAAGHTLIGAALNAVAAF